MYNYYSQLFVIQLCYYTLRLNYSKIYLIYSNTYKSLPLLNTKLFNSRKLLQWKTILVIKRSKNLALLEK